MRNKKYTGALCLLLALLLCAAGCGSASSGSINIDEVVISGTESSAPSAEHAADKRLVYATDGDVSYPAALYLLFMQDAFGKLQEAQGLEYSAVPTASVTLADGSAVTGSQYINVQAIGEFRWLYTIERLYREAGLSDGDSSFYSQSLYYAEEAYSLAPEYYDFFGITKDDLLRYYLYSYKYNDLFYLRYGEGGEKELSAETLSSMMETGSYRLQYTYLPYSDAQTGEALSAEQKAERKALSEGYLERYNSGESFEDIVYESYRYLDPATLRTDETSYDYYIAREGGSFPQELVSAVAALEDGKAQLVETDSYVAVVLRLPVNEKRDSAWRSAALQLAYDTYGDEFDADMLALYAETRPDYNESALGLLTPEYYAQMLERYYAQ